MDRTGQPAPVRRPGPGGPGRPRGRGPAGAGVPEPPLRLLPAALRRRRAAHGAVPAGQLPALRRAHPGRGGRLPGRVRGRGEARRAGHHGGEPGQRSLGRTAQDAGRPGDPSARACWMRTRAAGLADGVSGHASSRRDRVSGAIGTITGAFGICAVDCGTTARPRPWAAIVTTIGRALASNTIRGSKPAAAQAASRAARTPVPRGRLTRGTSRSALTVTVVALASG